MYSDPFAKQNVANSIIIEQEDFDCFGTNGNEIDLSAFYAPYIPLTMSGVVPSIYSSAVEDISENDRWIFALHKDSEGNFFPQAKDAFDWIMQNIPINSRKFSHAYLHHPIAFSTIYGTQYYSPQNDKNVIAVELFNKQTAALFKIMFQD